MQPFQELYENFASDEAMARSIDSPNPGDTDAIKMAIVGFSYNAPMEEWSLTEFEYVTKIILATQDLSEKEILFYVLGIGYLLGLARSQKIKSDEYKILLSQLPGFILLKGGNF